MRFLSIISNSKNTFYPTFLSFDMNSMTTASASAMMAIALEVNSKRKRTHRPSLKMMTHLSSSITNCISLPLSDPQIAPPLLITAILTSKPYALTFCVSVRRPLNAHETPLRAGFAAFSLLASANHSRRPTLLPMFHADLKTFSPTLLPLTLLRLIQARLSHSSFQALSLRSLMSSKCILPSNFLALFKT